MPNWITNKITAPAHVIAAVTNENSSIDFNRIAPFQGPRGADWNGYFGNAETAAQKALDLGFNSHPLVARLERVNRDQVDIKQLTDGEFAQFVGMMENYRACGFLHSMDWQREKWGTKWNACNVSISEEGTEATFETAWSCPETALIELSKRFPDDEISVIYADEDIGSNCGTFTLKAGAVTVSDIAPSWKDMDDAARKKWKLFACQVKGYDDEETAEILAG